MDHVAHIKPSDGSSAATQRTRSYQLPPLCFYSSMQEEIFFHIQLFQLEEFTESLNRR